MATPGEEGTSRQGADPEALSRLAARVKAQDARARAQGELAEKARSRAIEMRRQAQPDVLARVGGDEFVVLATRITHERQLVTVGARFGAALAEPFTLDDGDQIALTVTVGVAEPAMGMTAEEALADADHAMYTNKRARHR